MRDNKELIDIIAKVSEVSGYKLVMSRYNKETRLTELYFKGFHKFKVFAIIKNIVNSGWSDKPLIKRVQITKIDPSKLPISTFDETAMIIGNIKILDKEIFVLWSLYNNVAHKTNKSCYVQVENLFKGYIQGFHTCQDSKQRIWIADEFNLSKLFYSYLKYNNTTTE